MAAYGANYNISTGNPLCDKLRRQFADRCRVAVAKYSAVETSVMIERVQRGLNPYENAPDPMKEKRMANTARPAQSRTPASVQPNVRRAPEKKVNVAAIQRETPRAAAVSASNRIEMMRNRSAAAAARQAKAKAPVAEVRLARAPFPFAALVMLSIFTMMIMIIVLSFAQNYELSNEIDMLKAEQQALAEVEEELALRLEKRDDIRVIEDIAVNEIGMVKNDLVESRYVSVSGGNRVELAVHEDDDAKTQNGVLGNMLSAIGENFQRLREYID